MSGKLKPGGVVILAGALVLLIGSLLHMYADTNAWSHGLFPLTTLPVVLGLLMGGEVLVRALAPEIRLPPVLGFTWPKIHLLLGVWAALMMVSFSIGDAGALGITPSKSTGLWLMLAGSIALVAGALVETRSRPRLR